VSGESVSMRQIKNRNLAQLLVQLRFTPQKHRLKQLDSAEKLLAIIDKDGEYPFEFVFFKITGFRPKGLIEWQPIKGYELLDDLQIFISKLSSQVAPPAAEQEQKVYTIEKLAKTFDVSTKTVNRWRKRGLAARKFVFDDGKKRLGFLQSTVDEFLKANPDLVAKAKRFKRLTAKQKKQIIEQASVLSGSTTMSRYQIIEQIANKIGKVHETVRYILMDYEKAHPDKPIFNQPPGVISSTKSAELYNLYKQGWSITELMERFGRSESSIYRIINQRRAKALLARKFEFITSDEFLQESAKDKILSEPVISQKTIESKDTEPLELVGGSLPDYLEALKETPVLNRELETELFRRYNYLKYLAFKTRSEINLSRVSSIKLMKAEEYLAEAEAIKKRIIEANLRLVVSIASKHTTSGANMLDLVSEGNFSLMRAVEKFDYTKGFRFATYASWAIAKDYARKIPAEAARPDKAPTASLANVQRDLRTAEAAGVVVLERAHQSLIQGIKDNLNEREQYIILNHFGLLGTPIRKKIKTLKQIGEALGLSKERVRQIELIALQKLKHSLSIEQFELLTG